MNVYKEKCCHFEPVRIRRTKRIREQIQCGYQVLSPRSYRLIVTIILQVHPGSSGHSEVILVADPELAVTPPIRQRDLPAAGLPSHKKKSNNKKNKVPLWDVCLGEWRKNELKNVQHAIGVIRI